MGEGAADTKVIRPSDGLFLAVPPLAAAILTWYLPINLLLSTILFFVPSASYLSWQKRQIIFPTAVFAALITIISILTDYLAERDQSWVSSSSFDFRLAGHVPVEALVWVFLFTYLIIAVYLYYFGETPLKVAGKRMPAAYAAAFGVLLWLGAATFWKMHFKIDYFYIKFGLAIIFLPLVVFSLKFPRYLSVFIKVGPYFVVVGLLNILAGLHAGHWSYPGHHYVGWVQMGKYGFPIEELIFWIILYAPFLISQYELLSNDGLSFKRETTARP